MFRRNTIQRSLVYEAVNRLQSHATADEIYAAIAAEHPNISRATVYRNLNQLAEAGSLRRVDAVSECVRFDGMLEPHGHFVCTECGHIEDILPDCQTKIRGVLGAERKDLHISSVEVVVRGLCSSCARQKEPVQ